MDSSSQNMSTDMTGGSVDVDIKKSELIDMWLELKKVFRKEIEEKKKLEQKLAFIEDNGDWSKTYVNQLRDQLEDYKKCIDSLTQKLKTMDDIKEKNRQLEDQINQLNDTLKAAEEANNQSMIGLQKCLDSKNKEIKDLNLIISSKDNLLDQKNREISEIKVKGEEILNQLKEYYEQKISEIYKEYDQRYEKCLLKNDEKIIEVRANCMRSIDKTKEDYETKLTRIEFENRDLKERVSHLSLQLEAFKAQKTFKGSDNSKNITPKRSAQRPKTNRDSDRAKASMSFRQLESDKEDNDNTNEPPSASKRKKLPPNDSSYLDMIEDQDI